MKKNRLTSLLLDAYHRVRAPRVDRAIQRALALPQPEFPQSVNLPRPYGRGMNERVVELLIARLTYQPGMKVLDVGHANIMSAHARMLQALPAPKDITGIDIAPASKEIRSLYTLSVQGDITRTDFPPNTFDLIWCISALEHFGMDNSIYTDQFALDRDMDVMALREMMRILRVGGTIYISVPYGRFEDHGWLRNYDKELWQRLLATVQSEASIARLYFKYFDQLGWSPASPEDLVNTGYLDHKNSGASGLAVALIHKER